MKILNIIGSLDPAHGGAAEGTLKLAAIWQEQGHIVHFATLDPADAVFLSAIESSVVALGKPSHKRAGEKRPPLWRRFGYCSRFVPWLENHAAGYDAILVHGLWNYSTMAARRVLPRTKVPYFVFPHGSLDPWFRRTYPLKDFFKRLLWPVNEGVLANNASAVLFTTQEELELAKGSFRPWRIETEVVGFGTTAVGGDLANQVATFRAACPALADRRYLLFLGRLHTKKGCDLLIEAFAKVAERNKELDLVMAGPDHEGWLSRLQGQVARAGVAHRVHWTGMIGGDTKWGAFRGCEAFILPSHSENFGIVVAEALACAKPVLITDKVNLWREVAQANAGLIEPDTQDGIDRLLARFFGLSLEERAAMEVRARQCFEDHFRMERTAQAILDVVARRARTGKSTT